MKSDTVYKQTFNSTIAWLARIGAGNPLPSENAMSAELGVSRTTVRKVISRLSEDGFLDDSGLHRIVAKVPPPEARFPETETRSAAEQVERQFFEWILRGDARAGFQINELELARQFGVGTNGVREFLNRFKRFGLIEKRPNSGWRFMGFTREFATELFDIRELFELRSAVAFAALAPEDPAWADLDMIEAEHRHLLADIDCRFHDFSDLDNRFHRLINRAQPNRFIDDFYDVIAFVFHYHYQWNKKDERQRNEAAILEHLEYIEALKQQDPRKIKSACRRHLASARRTLLLATNVASASDK
ncbi:GntR family transcriptional regulator [Pelagibacterium limicola]|uniref:GntR family transcriptional regulator n=1 Tax=Pelagibacterium limicola TaxID=2791022 RepID=UPI0018AFB387|nr:GntR family transcriptional regulator [Pelagibacterium limicola]